MPEEFADRLLLLEEQNRRLFRWLFAVTALLGLLLMASATLWIRVPDTVAAHQFDLQDYDGNVTAVLRLNGEHWERGATLEFRGGAENHGRNRVMLVSEDGAGYLALYGPEHASDMLSPGTVDIHTGTSLVNISTTGGVWPTVSLGDTDGHVLLGRGGIWTPWTAEQRRAMQSHRDSMAKAQVPRP